MDTSKINLVVNILMLFALIYIGFKLADIARLLAQIVIQGNL